MSRNLMTLRYEKLRRKKAVGMLRKLADRVEKGELIVTSHGFWPSRLENRITFKIDVISRDDEKEIRSFEQFS